MTNHGMCFFVFVFMFEKHKNKNKKTHAVIGHQNFATAVKKL